MGGARKLWIVLLAAACAAALAACGGGDDGSSSDTTATTAESGTQAPGQGDAGGQGNGAQAKQKNGKEGEGGGGSQAGGGSAGGGESAPGGGESSPGGGGSGGSIPKGAQGSTPFRTPGGDNSIQEYGTEGDGGDRAEAETVVNALYRAIASGNWSEVCTKYLSATNIEQIELLAEKSPQIKGKDCAGVLGGLNQVSAGRSPDRPVEGIASMRIEGNTAFAIWRGSDGNGYALPLKREGGEWKLTALGPTPLNPGA